MIQQESLCFSTSQLNAVTELNCVDISESCQQVFVSKLLRAVPILGITWFRQLWSFAAFDADPELRKKVSTFAPMTKSRGSLRWFLMEQARFEESFAGLTAAEHINVAKKVPKKSLENSGAT